MTSQEMIASLRDFSGGLNWLDDEPSPNEFKALQGWENHGTFLRGIAGITLVTTTSGLKVNHPALYRAASPANDEYALFVSNAKVYSVKAKGTGASTATTYAINEIEDLGDSTVTVSTQNINETRMVPVRDMMFCFLKNGYNGKNLVAEYDTSKTSDFKLRSMGITAPNMIITATTGGSGLDGTFRYRYTFCRKDGTTILSESGANTGGAEAYYTEVVADAVEITLTLPATTSDTQVTHARLYRTRNLENYNHRSDRYYHLVDIAMTFSAGVGSVSSSYADSLTDAELWQQSASDILTKEFHAPMPAAQDGVFAGNRIWCTDGEFIYYSSTNQYDLETYDTRGYDVLPDGTTNFKTSSGFINAKLIDGQEVQGLFKVGNNLVVMKAGKTGVIFNADPSNGIKWTDEQIGSIYRASMVNTPWGMQGLTNEGVRIHDGVRWGTIDLSEKVIKQNEDDKTLRVLPETDVIDDTKCDMSAFFYENKYYIDVIGDIGAGQGTTHYVLVFDRQFGWAELPSTPLYTFDFVMPYDNNNKLLMFRNQLSSISTMFTGTQASENDITGIIQPGYVGPADHGIIDLDSVQVDAKLSNATSVGIKIPDGMHVVATNLEPNPADSEFNRYYNGLMAGFTTDNRMAVKLKGTVVASNFVKGINVFGRVHEGYGKGSKLNAGLLARYNFDTFANDIVADVSGNGLDLTFSYSSSSIATTTSYVVRENAIAITNGSSELSGFKNTTGISMPAEGEFSVLFKLYVPESGTVINIFRNTYNSQNFYLVRSSDNLLYICMNAKAYNWTKTFTTAAAAYAIGVRYKHKTGTYSSGLDYTADLFVGDETSAVTKYSQQATSGTAAAVSGTYILMDQDNDGYVMDELRVYSKFLTDEEMYGTLGEAYPLNSRYRHEYY